MKSNLNTDITNIREKWSKRAYILYYGKQPCCSHGELDNWDTISGGLLP